MFFTAFSHRCRVSLEISKKTSSRSHGKMALEDLSPSSCSQDWSVALDEVADKIGAMLNVAPVTGRALEQCWETAGSPLKPGLAGSREVNLLVSQPVGNQWKQLLGAA